MAQISQMMKTDLQSASTEGIFICVHLRHLRIALLYFIAELWRGQLAGLAQRIEAV